jgi:hypothetical protein
VEDVVKLSSTKFYTDSKDFVITGSKFQAR